ncbi:hypothetical protein SAMN05878443_1904 [Carnobacterium alterfunditum]|uniref:Uncharacterized protein n=1 Tax=Carnobacterium alterfunditum TaxID=28230 RepID=A0A1N6HJU4_9LACT|nr:hypothetical protein SAMN05878443_1904 [Carnobacterium alterfunditum]
MKNKKEIGMISLKFLITISIGLFSSFSAFLILQYFHLSMNFEAVTNFLITSIVKLS